MKLTVGRFCLNLAKIHMVTKLIMSIMDAATRLNLAKIHMVTKLRYDVLSFVPSLNLAKIHMVTKHK